MCLQVGQKAPDFTLPAVVDGEFHDVTLSDFQRQGKWTVLIFYPLDFTFVCPTEIVAFSDRVAEFERLGARIIACSIDSQFVHRAWARTSRREGGVEGIAIPLVADVKRSAAKCYDILIEPAGVALRGLFLIDPEGIVQYTAVHNIGVGRSVDETLRVLEACQHVKRTGEVCPANWKRGDPTMIPDVAMSRAYFEKLRR